MWCIDGVIEVLRALGFSFCASTVSVSVNVFFTGDLVGSKIDALGLSLNTASEIHLFLGRYWCISERNGWWQGHPYRQYQCDPFS